MARPWTRLISPNSIFPLIAAMPAWFVNIFNPLGKAFLLGLLTVAIADSIENAKEGEFELATRMKLLGAIFVVLSVSAITFYIIWGFWWWVPNFLAWLGFIGFLFVLGILWGAKTLTQLSILFLIIVFVCLLAFFAL